MEASCAVLWMRCDPIDRTAALPLAANKARTGLAGASASFPCLHLVAALKLMKVVISNDGNISICLSLVEYLSNIICYDGNLCGE